MKRSAVSKLGDPVWFHPLPESDPGLEVAILPAAAGEIDNLVFAVQRDQVVTRICQRLFVDFRGYLEDDGSPVRNDLDARLELFNVGPVGAAITSKAREMNEAVAKGEAVAASV